MTGGLEVDSTQWRNVAVEDVYVSVLPALCSYENMYFLGNCAVP